MSERALSGADWHLARVRGVLARHAENPPNQNQIFARQAEALHIATRPEGFFRATLKDAIEWRLDHNYGFNPAIFTNLLERNFHSFAMDPNEIGRYSYLHWFDPERPDAVARWLNFIEEGQDKHDTETDYNLKVRTVQSNYFMRGVAQKLMMKIFPERFGAYPSLFEPGSSHNLILNFLSEGTHFDVSVLDKERQSDQEMSRRVNHILIGNLALKYGLGLDIWDFQSDAATERWELDCTITPVDMLLRPAQVDESYRLAAIHPTNVGFHRMDFTDDIDLANFPPKKVRAPRKPHATIPPPDLDVPVEVFDSAFTGTVTHQLNKSERQKLENFMFENTKYDGIVVNQDFGEVVATAPCGIEPAKDIYQPGVAYNYTFFDKLNPESGWQHGFTFTSGRCEEMIIENGGLMVDGQVVSIRDRIKEAT